MFSTNPEPAEDDFQSRVGNGHDEDEAGGDDSFSSPYLKPSCQSCRLRKIRCDRNRPCTPCTRKKIECSFPPGIKVRERRQRVLITNSYEDKINDISRKVDQLCSIVNNQNHPPSQSRPSAPSPSSTTLSCPDTMENSRQTNEISDSSAEGEPALAAQAAFATSYAQRAFAYSVVSQEMTLSLERLAQMVREGRNRSGSREPDVNLLEPGSNTNGMTMPPLELTISCIQKLRNSESIMFFWTWDIDNVGQLLEYTTTVYTGKPSIAELIIVNSSLSRLLCECIREEAAPSAQAELKMQAGQCEKNLNTLLSRLPFNLASNFDNILALFQAAVYAMGQCKTLTAWKYIAASVQMCQTLGYHREVALIPERAQQKRRRKRLVWMIVIVDKCLSLRLGRPSAIRDSDFTLERVTDAVEDDISALGPASILPKWIDFSLLQGQVFDDIYSPAALLRPESIRVARARALATNLQRVLEERTPTETQFLDARRQALGADMHDLLQGADRINVLATLTLVYRAIPAGQQSGSAFCEECIATAHEALSEHQKCLAILRNVEGSVVEMYLQWAFLSSPFIPFIVLFCRVFETSDPVHLEKLASVVETLKLPPDDLPEAYGRQLQIFEPMYEVAFNYIQANSNERPQSRRVSDADFDTIFREAAIGTGLYGGRIQPGQRDDSHGVVVTPSSPGIAYLSGFQPTYAPQMGDLGSDLGHLFDQNQGMDTMLEDTF